MVIWRGDETMTYILKDEWKEIDLDYVGENKITSFFSSEGSIHTYPAKAVPEMINSLLEKLIEKFNVKSVLDPFMGSGTVALEAKYLGLNFYGCDLNPLAILLARTKALTIHNTSYVKNKLICFCDSLINDYSDSLVVMEEFDNIEYWFKEENIKQLSFIKKRIQTFLDKSKSNREVYALILLTAFSSTIRKSSLTRNGEFKLYRLPKSEIKRFHIDSIKTFRKNIGDLLDLLVVSNASYHGNVISEIKLNNAKNLSFVKNKDIDLIITSPPYGDSKSTVAYGQFSRLSLQWMKTMLSKYLLINCDYVNCDEYLLGGKKSNINIDNGYYQSKTLSKLLKDMDKIINLEIKEKNKLKAIFSNIINIINNNLLNDLSDICDNMEIYDLIYERVRLDNYKRVSSEKNELSDKKIKQIAKIQSNKFMKELIDGPIKLKYKRSCQLKRKLPLLVETLDRKIEALPKRKYEVDYFLKDLYSVVIESDKVLSKQGIQTWIVGHRTVLGKVVINLEGIIRDWFENLGYSVVTSLKRKYSFKRMPNHINSTISRKDKISTMMYEYILIVKKEDLN